MDDQPRRGKEQAAAEDAGSADEDAGSADEGAGKAHDTRAQPSDRLPSDYEDPIDEAAADSFPASDPPSFTDTTATRNPGEH
jgi:hypothetical protein